MNAQTLRLVAAPCDALTPVLQYKLNRIAELARAGAVLVEHELGRAGPAAMLEALLSAIEDDACEALERVDGVAD